ncbi:hypothetical protein ABFX02_07G080800 [Erythranthe guttata]
MASSKNLFLLLGVLLVLALFISSQVAASQDDLTSESAVVTADGKDGHGHGYGYPGKGGRGGGGGKLGGYRGGGGKGKGGCRYGCCRGYRYSHGCNRCCSTANEAHDLHFADDIPN